MRLIATLTLLTQLAYGAPPSGPQTCSGGDVITSCEYGATGLDLASLVRDDPPADAEQAAELPDGLPALRSTREPTCVEDGLNRCELIINVPPEVPEQQAPDPITIADLASFTPAVGELVVQPDGWGVLGVPTNFVATATEHVQSGTLLGQPVQVRWRPTAFAFAYGDGSTTTTSHGGAQWTSSSDEWTATATSHEYRSLGSFVASVTVTFEAAVATNDGWTQVPGSLDVATAETAVRVFQVETVLTRGDCLDHPGDVGCVP